jgi:zinc transport system substrate-binding protein
VPQPRSIAALAKASFLLTIGVPFEKALLRKVRGAFPSLSIIDGRAGMELMPMDEGLDIEGDGHDHHGHGHDHGDQDPHVWLSLGNMKVHARTVARELSARLPEHRESIEMRAMKYIASLEKLDMEFRRQLAPLKGRTAMVFHPAFGYFLKRYGLRQLAVEMGGHEPTGRYLGELMRIAKEHHVRCIFVQPQFNGKTVRVVAKELGGAVLTLDPLPTEYSSGMRQMCQRFLSIGNFP